MEPPPPLPRVRSVDSGDTESLARLYARACPRLVAALTAIGGNRADAEEVAQEAFVTLLEKWPQVRGYDDPEAWLRLVAVRRLVSRHRRHQVARSGLERLRARAGVGLPPADGQRLDVERALARLPLAQRAVVVLHHGLDLPVAQVADTLGVAEGTVKSRLARARATLADLLADHAPTGSTT